MRLKTSILLIFVCVSIVLCSCSAGTTITTDSNKKYKYDEIISDVGDLTLPCGSFYKADADTLRSYTKIMQTTNVSIPTNAQEAAKIGASVLDSLYNNWSESNKVIVHFNNEANAWIIHGQAINRKSNAKCGVIAIESTTGEVLCIVYE